jgi:hypothetical protein
MQIVNRANLPADALTALAAALPRVATLLELIPWARARAVEIMGAVTQDEYTHDLVLRWGDGLYLVYGAT